VIFIVVAVEALPAEAFVRVHHPMMAGAASAETPGVERAPTPDWVEVLPIPEPRETRLPQAVGGLYLLLYDTQTKWKPGAFDAFERLAYKVLDWTGIEEAAQITLDFDPDTQRLTIHEISIPRDGLVLDRLFPHFSRVEL
jgi:hypothetical protein